MLDSKTISGFAAMLAFAGSMNLANAQSSNPAWLEQVTAQLAQEQLCEVGFFISFKEGSLGGRNTYEARAQCVDGRQFDANKVEPALEFTLKECAVSVC